MLTHLALFSMLVFSLERPEVEYKIFQFPADQIPRIDGKTDDWSIVPESYAVTTEHLRETVIGLGDQHDKQDLDVSARCMVPRVINAVSLMRKASERRSGSSRVFSESISRFLLGPTGER